MLSSNLFQTLNIYVNNMATTKKNPLVKHKIEHLFTNNTTTDNDIYPPTLYEIIEAQHRYKLFSKYFKDKPFKGKDSKLSSKVIGDIRTLM